VKKILDFVVVKVLNETSSTRVLRRGRSRAEKSTDYS
jgi:hypothetical protein